MKIEIYGTEWCSYCKQAIKVCESNNYEYTYINVDSEAVKTLLESRLGGSAKTVPQIFVDDEHVGGYTEFVAYLQDLS